MGWACYMEDHGHRVARGLPVWASCAILFGLVLLSCGCGLGTEPGEALLFRGETMGTAYTVKVVTEQNTVEPEALRKAIQAELDDVDGKMSTYKPDSELSRFNASKDTAPFTVSGETAAVFEKALQISALSGGAFDITVGLLVNAWGFGPDAVPTHNPSEQDLAALEERVGYTNINVDRAASTLTKRRADVYCDLSAVAKGYAVDRVAELLNGRGCGHYMVEVGGEVRTKGRNDRGQLWRIAIEKPDPAGRTIQRVVPMGNRALATSGDYRNYYERDGIRLSHTIDPRTGRPIRHGLASVSVLHEECAMADGWATALMVLGPDEGFRLAESHKLSALFIIRESGGGFVERMTPAFKELAAQTDGASGSGQGEEEQESN